MSKKHKPDYVLLGTVLALVIFGLIILASASIAQSFQKHNEPYFYLKHQLLFGVLIGLIGFFIAQKINYQIWRKLALVIFILGLLLLGLVFVPNIGLGNSGARRWVQIFGFSFQPAEIVKLCLIIFLASLLSKHVKLIVFLGWLALISLFFIFQPDIGTLGLIIIFSLVMYFIAGAKLKHISIVILTGAIALIGLIKLAPYRLNRLLVFLHPEIDPQGIGYQINQAFLALGSGGLFGLGLGHGQQKYNYLPATATDSIFAILGEELGFIGAVFLLVLFIVFALRGFRIADKAPDKFGQLLGAGITSWLIFQAFINIMAITGLMPLTGIPLPFVSYGSSSMIVSLVSAGILLNISKHTKA